MVMIPREVWDRVHEVTEMENDLHYRLGYEAGVNEGQEGCVCRPEYPSAGAVIRWLVRTWSERKAA